MVSLRSAKVETAPAELPPKLMSLADWAGPPDDSQLPGFKEQPPAPTPVDPLGLSPASLGGVHFAHDARALHRLCAADFFTFSLASTGASQVRSMHVSMSCR